MKIAVLMTCFNRVETTLDCLRHLVAAKLPDGVSFDVWLNDDASPDGTGAKVKAAFPRVNVITGSGHDFWCGGMRRAWDAASTARGYDGYLWLNDDTMLDSDALESLTERMDGIVVGATQDATRSITTYSGRGADGSRLEPNGEFQPCRAINGNAVFVPAKVFEALGNFPAYLTHGIGDYDYGFRANKVGIPVVLAKKHVGVCEAKKTYAAWRDPKVPLCKRLKNLYSPLGGPEPPVFFRYNLVNFGLAVALRHWLAQHARVILPGISK